MHLGQSRSMMHYQTMASLAGVINSMTHHTTILPPLLSINSPLLCTFLIPNRTQTVLKGGFWIPSVKGGGRVPPNPLSFFWEINSVKGGVANWPISSFDESVSYIQSSVQEIMEHLKTAQRRVPEPNCLGPKKMDRCPVTVLLCNLLHLFHQRPLTHHRRSC